MTILFTGTFIVCLKTIHPFIIIIEAYQLDRQHMVTRITVSKPIGADAWLVKDPPDSCIALGVVLWGGASKMANNVVLRNLIKYFGTLFTANYLKTVIMESAFFCTSYSSYKMVRQESGKNRSNNSVIISVVGNI